MSKKSNVIRTIIRRWLGIEGLVWKHAMTCNYTHGIERMETAYEPKLPDQPGNWELVSVQSIGLHIVFWWKALADEGQPQGEE